MWEGFVETLLLEGMNFLRGEDRVLVFVAEEEDSLESGDDGWLEVLFFEVEKWGLSSTLRRTQNQRRDNGWDKNGGRWGYDGMRNSALTEVKHLIYVDLRLCTTSNTTFDLFEFLHDRNHFLCQRTFHLPF